MKTARDVITEWERQQTTGFYRSYEQSMNGLSALIDQYVAQTNVPEPVEDSPADDISSYREEQARWRAAGFDAYNCDMVDEFPRW